MRPRHRLCRTCAPHARTADYPSLCLLLFMLVAPAHFSAAGASAHTVHPVLVSVNSSGTATGNRSSGANRIYGISADGRYVVFTSTASDLVPNDNNSTNDVFVRDMQAGKTSLVSVNYATRDGTARAGSDYTAATGTLNWADGDTSPKSFTVPVINDTLSEASETINLSFTGAAGPAAGGTPPVAVINITDNDPPPSLRVGNVAVPEGGTGQTIAATFRVSLASPSGQTVTVNYATADGTAAAGSDYTAASGTLTFNPGETSKTVSVNVLGDAVVEPDETFSLNLSDAINATIGSGGTCTITNDDPGTQFDISGTVNDPSTGGVGGVTLTLHPDQAGTTLTTQTDANGNYAFLNLPLGRNSVTLTPSKAGLSFSPQSSGLISSRGLDGNNSINFAAGKLFTANLNGAQVVPPTNSGALGFGSIILSQDETRASVDLNFGALTGTERSAHIHSSTGPGANGPTLFTLPSGVVSAFLISLAPAQVQLLKAGQLYFDVHTSAFLGGEIRGQITAPPLPSVQFDAASYNVGEQGVRATLAVTRSGDLTSPSTVSYQTVDDPAAIRCDDTVNNHGAAYARCDYATTVDTITFAAGEAGPKQITIPITDDAHVEGSESFQVRLFNPVGATLGTTSAATVNIIDNDTSGQPNPILGTDFFVRQQYLDFLSRDPEAGQPWSAVINNCPPNDPSCDRVSVSANFFRSQEFQLKGLFVFHFYKVGFGRIPFYTEIVAEMSSVTGSTTAELVAKKGIYTAAFAQRQEFKNTYDSMTNQQFVDALMGRYSLQSITTINPASPDDPFAPRVTLTRADLVGGLNGATLTRGQVVRALADSKEVGDAEFNPAFVAMQYFGYLRRDPEAQGYADWLATINTNPSDVRSMVNGFVNSTEYRLRFGRP